MLQSHQQMWSRVEKFLKFSYRFFSNNNSKCFANALCERQILIYSISFYFFFLSFYLSSVYVLNKSTELNNFDETLFWYYFLFYFFSVKTLLPINNTNTPPLFFNKNETKNFSNYSSDFTVLTEHAFYIILYAHREIGKVTISANCTLFWISALILYARFSRMKQVKTIFAT